VKARVANPTDVPTITATITAAFHDDPVWGWAFPDPDRRPLQYMVWWRFFVEASLPDGWVWVTEHAAAVSVWVPPGRPELSEHDEARLGPMLDELIDARAPLVMEAVNRFDANHPREEPHFYLSIVATDPDYRGQGIGARLLADNLALIDEQHAPAYLESSNPLNVKLYERLGFHGHGEFDLPEGGPPVTTMWREAR
jgi:GNAT superfamily N-acetyltransferase